MVLSRDTLSLTLFTATGYLRRLNRDSLTVMALCSRNLSVAGMACNELYASRLWSSIFVMCLTPG